jgi:uncharacterized membrane protein YdbT with pleckstrin-like domain
MSYVQRVLQPGEDILYSTKLHWWIYLPAIGPLLLSVALGLGSFFVTPELGLALLVGAGIFLLVALPVFLRAFIARATTELAVTSKRVIHKTGLFRRHTFEMNVSQVESVGVEQSILGRIFGFGELSIYGAGGSPQRIPTIRDPLNFRSHVTAR